MPHPQQHDPQQPDRRQRRKRSLGRRIGCGCLAALFAGGFGLVVLEWILRSYTTHFLGNPAAQQGMYESSGGSFHLAPGWTGVQTVGGRTTGIRVNSLGMRGPEPGPKRPGEVRVLVLGDSFVFGHGVAEDETVPARLAMHLQAALAAPVTGGNGGVPGYGTRLVAASLDRYRRFQPDAVVAFTYLGNDFSDDGRHYSAVVEGYLLFGAMARAADESTRFRLTMRYRTLLLLERALANIAPALAFDRSRLQPTAEESADLALYPPVERSFAGLFFDRRADDALVREVTERCRTSYLRLAAAAGEIPVLHVILPFWSHLFPDVWAADLRRQGYDPAAHEPGLSQRRLLAIGAELGLRMVDLTPGLRTAPDPESLWLPGDRHLSAAGCDLAARWLVPEVRRLLGR